MVRSRLAAVRCHPVQWCRTRLMDRAAAALVMLLAGFVAAPAALAASATNLVFVCRASNDLFLAVTSGGAAFPRFDNPVEGVERASEGAGVLVLAEGYPGQRTSLPESIFVEASRKRLRLFVEFPSHVPDLNLGPTLTLKTGHWGNILERTVVSSDAFGPMLPRNRILMVHDCRYISVESRHPHLVIARVAGYDTALYGIPPSGTMPILFEHPRGDLMIATTKLSQFVTGRYAPNDAWQPVWQMILAWLQPGAGRLRLEWSPTVRPAYGKRDPLPGNVERTALRRGADWYLKSGLLVHPSWETLYDRASNEGPPTKDWPDGHRAGPGPTPDGPRGDGSLGLLEGFRSKIYLDGSQAVLWWRRADNHGESAGALALAGAVLSEGSFSAVGRNLVDWMLGRSRLATGPFADPGHPAFGLTGWNDVERYYQGAHGYQVIWSDDNARGCLGVLRAATALRTDRYDGHLARQLIALLRLTGQTGFAVTSHNVKALEREGWQPAFQSQSATYSPHYQSYVHACHLWAYHATGFPLFRDRATNGIARMMQAYPERWSATNDQYNQERARILLALAWLVRVEDTMEHRSWLRRVAEDMVRDMDESGAIITRISRGPESNAAYGTGETTLIQQNGDPNADLFYTMNFALAGLHEAAAATRETFYRDAEDRVARFFCRVQVRSESHPELDGAWFRGFDYRRWEYWGSDADVGWSLYSIETGWIQGEVLSVLALRQLGVSLWDFAETSGVASEFKRWRPAMLPDAVLSGPGPVPPPKPPQ